MIELVRSQLNVKGRFQRAGVGAGLFTRKCEGKFQRAGVRAGSFTTKCERKNFQRAGPWSWFICKEM